MRRAAKDRSGAVIHQNKIGDIDGKRPIWIEWMGDTNTRIEAFFLSFINCFLGRTHFAAIVDKGRKLWIICSGFFG